MTPAERLKAAGALFGQAMLLVAGVTKMTPARRTDRAVRAIERAEKEATAALLLLVAEDPSADGDAYVRRGELRELLNRLSSVRRAAQSTLGSLLQTERP